MQRFRVFALPLALVGLFQPSLVHGASAQPLQKFVPDDTIGSRPGTSQLSEWQWKAAADLAGALKLIGQGGEGWNTARAGADVFKTKPGFAVFRVVLPTSTSPNRVLHFPGLDDSGTVYLNGTKLVDHSGWNVPFDVPLDATWKTDAPNVLEVIVQNNAGPGGIEAIDFTDGKGPVDFDAIVAQPAKVARVSSFDSNWRFFRIDDKAQNDMTAQGSDFNDAAWEKVVLPHTVRVEPRVVRYPFQGFCWYRKTFNANPDWKGQRVIVEFGAAMQIADVWINGKLKTHHLGGYQKFQIDLADDLNYGGSNTLAVRLDNRDTELVPPAKPIADLDFSYFGGLYRDVNLIVTSPLHISDPIAANVVAGGGVFVTYQNVSPASAMVNIKTHVINESPDFVRNCVVLSTLIDPQGRKVARLRSEPLLVAGAGGHEFEQSVTLPQPQLWSPDHPSLYTVRSAVLRDNQVVDLIETRIGIRQIALTNRFLLNGSEFHINGTNRHQEYPYIGNALSRNAARRDAKLIKDAGFNYVRLCHYPQDPAFLDACDEYGLLVQAPIPGWQMFRWNDSFIQNTFRDIRELIRRDRNHPCVVFWEPNLNETDAGQTDWCRSAYEVAHQEYPGDQCLTFGDAYPRGWSGWDVKGMVREYGDFGFGGNESTSRHARGEGEQALLQQAWNYQWCFNDMNSAYKDPDPKRLYYGCATWVMFDYNRGYYPKPCLCGMADIYRLPKYIYYFFQSQRDPNFTRTDVASGPMVYLANQWTKRGATTKVVAYSNCDEVELQINGKTLRRQKPDSGPDTRYSGMKDVTYETNGVDYNTTGGNPFDGGNANNVPHPPFTFKDVPYTPGELKAIGYLNGKAVTQSIVRTPDAPASIRLEFDTEGTPLAADGADAVFVRAVILDKNGTIVPDASLPVTFAVNGPAKLVGTNPQPAEAGIASILLQANEAPGAITVTAKAAGLPVATSTITSQ